MIDGLKTRIIVEIEIPAVRNEVLLPSSEINMKFLLVVVSYPSTRQKVIINNRETK